jgi:hypothetical protein
MRKVGLLLLILVILGGWAVKGSEAGQWCWELTPVDFVKLSYAKNDASYPFWTLNGIWYEPAPYNSLIPLDGTMIKNGDGTQRIFMLTGSLASNNNYLIRAVIDTATKNGTFSIHYVNGGGETDVPMTKVPCNTLPPIP